MRGTYIHENQNLNASFANGLAFNPNNTLNEARAYASLAYGNNNRLVLTGQYFSSWGTPDALLFAGNANSSPNTNGWIAEIAYIPFISSQAPGGRGSTCGSACNTPRTRNSTAPAQAPAPTTPSFFMHGLRCSGIRGLT